MTTIVRLSEDSRVLVFRELQRWQPLEFNDSYKGLPLARIEKKRRIACRSSPLNSRPLANHVLICITPRSHHDHTTGERRVPIFGRPATDARPVDSKKLANH